MTSDTAKNAARAKMRKLIDRAPTESEVRISIEEMRTANNDRARALLAAASLDNALQRAITSRLRQKSESTKQFFRHGFTCGSFDDKILTAYCMEIIGKVAKAALTDIRDIRNVFAHTSISIGFDTPDVANFLSHMQLFRKMPGLYVLPFGPFFEAAPTDDREKFFLSSQNIAVWLDVYSRAVKSQRDSGEKIIPSPLPLP